MSMRRDILIILASDRTAANTACENAGLGPDTFGPELCPADREPPDPPGTHRWCNTTYGVETCAALDGASVPYIRYLDSRGVMLNEHLDGGSTPDEVLAAEGLRLVVYEL